MFHHPKALPLATGDSSMVYYIIYKTTNLINGKTYIGRHKTIKIDDGYLGSGTIFLKALKKYR